MLLFVRDPRMPIGQGTKRLWEVQIQGRFLKPIEGFHMGLELTEPLSMSLFLRGITSGLVGFIRSFESDIHSSFGSAKHESNVDARELPHIVTPLFKGVDLVIETPDGSGMSVPMLGADLIGTGPRQPKSERPRAVRLDATYTFCVFSSYLDIWSWRFNLGLPFGAVEMATFSRDASLRVAGYTIQKPSTSGASLPSVNRRERERVHADAHKSYFLCLELPPPHARHASTASPVVAPAAGSVTRILAGLSDIGRQLSGELSSAHHEEVEALSEAEGGGKSRGRTKLSRLWRRRRSRRPSTSLETPSVTIDMSADGTAANDQPSPNGSGAPVSEATPTARSMEDEEEEERDLVEAAQQRLLNWMWGKAPPHVPKNQMPVAVVEESTGSADPVSAVRRSWRQRLSSSGRNLVLPIFRPSRRSDRADSVSRGGSKSAES